MNISKTTTADPVIPAIRAAVKPAEIIDDRKLSDGKIKDAITGEVYWPTATPLSDFPKDLPSSNKGF